VACTGCAAGVTGDPDRVSHDGVSLLGQVVSDAGGEVEYWVQYGPTQAYGSQSEHQMGDFQPNAPRQVRVDIHGLERSTAYHYRFCAQDGAQEGGPGCGEDRTFKTQTFACGETVTASVRFTGNVQCPDSGLGMPGIVVGAPGIEIDMNGFELRSGPYAFDAAPGIDNRGGFSDVTIRDGSISGTAPDLYRAGVLLDGASRNRILHVKVWSGGSGFDIRGGADNEVRHADLLGFNGVIGQDTARLVVADSKVKSLRDGIRFSGVSDGRIVRNVLDGEGTSLCCIAFGIRVDGDRNVIKENGVTRWIGANVLVASGADNKLLENTVGGARWPTDPPQQDYFGDGIFVGAFPTGTVLRGNVANDGLGDGIDVQNSTSRLTQNSANDNADFGIDAVVGVSDGGGNTASGNRGALQCRNVFCP